MAKLLFKLKGVFDDEADEIRSLLNEHDIDYYESPGGNWGISMHALWLRDETQYEAARQLIDDYQRQRLQTIQQQHSEQKARGEHETLIQRIRNQPLTFIFYLAFILFILYLSIVPFFELAG